MPSRRESPILKNHSVSPDRWVQVGRSSLTDARKDGGQHRRVEKAASFEILRQHRGSVVFVRKPEEVLAFHSKSMQQSQVVDPASQYPQSLQGRLPFYGQTIYLSLLDPHLEQAVLSGIW